MSKTRKIRRARNAVKRAQVITNLSHIARDNAIRKSEELELLMTDMRDRWDKVASLLTGYLPRGNVLRNLADGVPEVVLDWRDVDRLNEIREHGYRIPVPTVDHQTINVETIYPLILDYAENHGKRHLEYTLRLNYGDQRAYYAVSPELLTRLNVADLLHYIGSDLVAYLQRMVKEHPNER